MSEHTPTPWEYRPHQYDDWGYIRGCRPEFGSCVGSIAAIARGADGKSHDEHRSAGTDPYEANARLIVEAVNNHESLKADNERLKAEVIRLSNPTPAEIAAWVETLDTEQDRLVTRLRSELDQARGMGTKGLLWERADKADIDQKAHYLVADNGREWRDFDLHVMLGFMVKRKLEPNYVRGRPEWIAKIVRPDAWTTLTSTERLCPECGKQFPCGCVSFASPERQGTLK